MIVKTVPAVVKSVTVVGTVVATTAIRVKNYNRNSNGHNDSNGFMNRKNRNRTRNKNKSVTVTRIATVLATVVVKILIPKIMLINKFTRQLRKQGIMTNIAAVLVTMKAIVIKNEESVKNYRNIHGKSNPHKHSDNCSDSDSTVRSSNDCDRKCISIAVLVIVKNQNNIIVRKMILVVTVIIRTIILVIVIVKVNVMVVVIVGVRVTAIGRICVIVFNIMPKRLCLKVAALPAHPGDHPPYLEDVNQKHVKHPPKP